MALNSPKDGLPARPNNRRAGKDLSQTGRGYLPAKNDPNVDRNAVGENLRNPRKRDVSNGLNAKDDRTKNDG